jgi:5-methylcytosine-specific restriction endonuclease McrA
VFVSPDEARINLLLDERVSLAEVARRTGIPFSVVREHRDARVHGHRASQALAGPGRCATTADEIRRLLADGLSRAEIGRRLDVSRSTVSYHAKQFGLEMDQKARRRYDWSLIQAYYDDGHSVRECMDHFGFSSASWTDAARRGDAVARPTSMPIAQLIRQSRSRTNLKRRLVEAGLLSTSCGECGINRWRGRRLALELHHLNGDGRDNRLENLTLLCPNCHSQTDSWGGRNSRRTGAQSAAG